jgi:pSer/pThr/pTyr-binding forkhead associated (FHA) protein
MQAVLAAERAHEPFLVVRDGDSQLQLIALTADARKLTVGRRAEMDVSIGWDAEVSGLHAELQAFSGEWTILDDGLSTNGTFVNGNRVRGRQRLRDGDRVRVGKTVIVYRSVDTVTVPRTAPTGEQPSAAALTDTQRRVLIALCRPYRDGDRFATPSSNAQIAAELFVTVDAVKAQLRVLFTKFELGDLPQHEKRVRLAECVIQYGLISPQDLD